LKNLNPATQINPGLDKAECIERLNMLIPESENQHTHWMIQLGSETKDLWEREFLQSISLKNAPVTLGRDFYSISLNEAANSRDLLKTIFPRWICPILHQWPVNPRSEKFVERACSGIQNKLGLEWQNLQVLSATPELKKVVTGIKGRLLQIKDNSENTAASDPSILVILVHPKGLLAGLCGEKLELGSGYAGGLGFLKEKSAHSDSDESQARTSRAGGKISEVLAMLEELKISSKEYPNWLELGAAPGGMTEELTRWGASVTAVDLAELSPLVKKNKKVTHLKINADEIRTADHYDAILCDMNGPTANSAKIVAKLIPTLSSGSLIIHTLKVTSFETLKAMIQLVESVFTENGAKIIAIRHLFHNRKEVTVIALRR
jgi:23S rRNA U2552 (ribose-2'-O)-methylase RlmE/FtsJ